MNSLVQYDALTQYQKILTLPESDARLAVSDPEIYGALLLDASRLEVEDIAHFSKPNMQVLDSDLAKETFIKGSAKASDKVFYPVTVDVRYPGAIKTAINGLKNVFRDKPQEPLALARSTFYYKSPNMNWGQMIDSIIIDTDAKVATD